MKVPILNIINKHTVSSEMIHLENGDCGLKLAMKGKKSMSLFACVIIDDTDQLNSWKLCVKEF
jgi:hypothetical protein